MTRIRLVITGQPIPKPRPRVVRLKNGRSHTFTPEEATTYEQRIKNAARLVLVPFFVGRIRIEVDVYLDGRVSFDKRGSGDWDNYAKMAADALEGIAYANDATIVKGSCEKHPVDAEGPRMVIVLEGEPGAPAVKKRHLKPVPSEPKDWKSLATPASYSRKP